MGSEPPSPDDTEPESAAEQERARKRRAFQCAEKMGEAVREEQYERRHGLGYSHPDGTWVSKANRITPDDAANSRNVSWLRANEPLAPELGGTSGRVAQPPSDDDRADQDATYDDFGKPADEALPVPDGAHSLANWWNSLGKPQREGIGLGALLLFGIALWITLIVVMHPTWQLFQAVFLLLAAVVICGASLGLALLLPRSKRTRAISVGCIVPVVVIVVAVTYNAMRGGPSVAGTEPLTSATPPGVNAVGGASRRKERATLRKEAVTVRGHAILNVSPEKLESLCDGYTSIRCAQLRKPYEGQWVRWTGTVEDVYESPGVSLIMPSRDGLNYSILVEFKESERTEVTHLRVGDKIIVLGRLLGGGGGILEEAELLRNETAEAPAK